nr:ribonuclease H-like domain-containing protein [Tanacetum cinerariifolium]
MRIMPAGKGAKARGEVGRGVLVLFRSVVRGGGGGFGGGVRRGVVVEWCGIGGSGRVVVVVGVVKPHNKTPYKLFQGRKLALSFMRPFGCLVTILNTLDHLGIRPNWMFDINSLTMSMNYQPVFAVNQTNGNAGPKSSEDEVADDAGNKSTKFPRKENEVQDPAKEGDKNDQEKDVRDQEEAPRQQFKQESKRLFGQRETANTNSTNRLNTVSSPVNTISSSFTSVNLGKERAQRNEFESMFGQDKDANGNMIFTLVSAVGSTYAYLGGSIHVNAATLPNADLPTHPLI